MLFQICCFHFQCLLKIMTGSSPGGNYTSFELRPMFLTLSTPGFVENIIYFFRYLCGWYRDWINVKLQRFKWSRRDAGGGKVPGNYFQNKTFFVLIFYRPCQIFYFLLKLKLFHLGTSEWILPRKCETMLSGFCLFCFLHPWTLPELPL